MICAGVFERLYAEAYKEPNFAQKRWEDTCKRKSIQPQWRPVRTAPSRLACANLVSAFAPEAPAPAAVVLWPLVADGDGWAGVLVQADGAKSQVTSSGFGFH